MDKLGSLEVDGGEWTGSKEGVGEEKAQTPFVDDDLAAPEQAVQQEAETAPLALGSGASTDHSPSAWTSYLVHGNDPSP